MSGKKGPKLGLNKRKIPRDEMESNEPKQARSEKSPCQRSLPTNSKGKQIVTRSNKNSLLGFGEVKTLPKRRVVMKTNNKNTNASPEKLGIQGDLDLDINPNDRNALNEPKVIRRGKAFSKKESMKKLNEIDKLNHSADELDYSDVEEGELEDGEQQPQGDGVAVEIHPQMRPSDDEYQDTDEEDNTEQFEMQENDGIEQSADEEVSFNERRADFRRKVQSDPHLKSLLYELVDERVQEQMQVDRDRQSTYETPKDQQRKQNVSKKSKGISGVYGNIPINFDNVHVQDNVHVNKSPSDSTLYTPALKKGVEVNGIIDRISNFVETIRLESEGSNRKNSPSVKSVVRTPQQSGKKVSQHQAEPHCSHQLDDDLPDRSDPVKEKVNQIILNAEKMKANLVAPKGDYNNLPFEINSDIQLLRQLDSDEDFSQISCHVDSSLKLKIERGEFVDLEKLIPKDRSFNGYAMDDEQGIKLLTKDGYTYLGSPPNEKKINNIRRWDQAFRVYATIYSMANPNRSGEIWQYVHAIHTAANTYLWDNVSFYDFSFRHLMANKPWRSWAKTYTEGWNMVLKGPSMRQGLQNRPQSSYDSQGNGVQKSNKSWRDDCCWRYNKNSCKRPDCKYDHRCTHCAGWGHGYNVCRKRLKNGSRGNNGGNGSGSSASGSASPVKPKQARH